MGKRSSLEGGRDQQQQVPRPGGRPRRRSRTDLLGQQQAPSQIASAMGPPTQQQQRAQDQANAQQQQQAQSVAAAAGSRQPSGSNQQVARSPTRTSLLAPAFRLMIPRPSAIVMDLLGVLVRKSFMTSSREFRDYFQHNVLEYLSDNWKQKQLKIMINFFRCGQTNVPDDYKLAERDEPREDQIKQAKKHIIWKLRNEPTNSALSLFMLGITEWGYRNKTLVTSVYDEVPAVLKSWKEQYKIPIYVGVGSADFLIMVLTNTNFGNILPYFHGHMNIMDFDGTRANKDFKKLSSILKLPPERILYLTRFRQDCKRAIENGLQSIIVLRPDFDSHGSIGQLKQKRGSLNSADGTKLLHGRGTDDANSPPTRNFQMGYDQLKNDDMKRHYEKNVSTLSIIDDHDANDPNQASSTIFEADLTRYNLILSLAELTMK